MTARQIYLAYVEPPRGEHGQIDYPPLVIGEPMGDEEMFRYRLFLNRVRDPAAVERLWREERERQRQREGGDRR